MAGSYVLDDFTHEMLELIAAEPDDEKVLDKASSLLERLIGDQNCIPEEYKLPSVRVGRDAPHGSYLLHRSPELLVTAEVWGPGDHVDPHDHHTWGMIGVLDNTLEEKRFRRLDDGSNKERALLELNRETLSKPGEVSLLIPGIDEIHQIDNTDDKPTVEIHVYGQDLATIDRCIFHPETGQIKSFKSSTKYDNE
jgi:predicted metal-dependent enzyme (double-stranded beta helix superfamily)